MASIHNVFHLSLLKKYVPDSLHFINSQGVQIQEDMSYKEKQVDILDRKTKTLSNNEIPVVIVIWCNHKVEEATWEREDVFELLGFILNFKDNFYKVRRVITSKILTNNIAINQKLRINVDIVMVSQFVNLNITLNYFEHVSATRTRSVRIRSCQIVKFQEMI